MIAEPLGISTYLFCQEKLCREHLQMIAGAGIRFLEIWGCPSHFDYDNLAYVSDMQKMILEYGLRVHSLHTTSGLADDSLNTSIFSLDDETRAAAVAEVKKQVDALDILKGQMAIVHPGGAAPGEERELHKQKSGESVREIADYCALKGLKVAIENTLVDGAICRQADELRDYVDSFGQDNVGICFDTSHANLTQDIFVAQRTCAEKVITLHISDNHGRKDDHLVPFEGQINWSEFMNILKDVGYGGVFMFEIAGGHNNTEILSNTEAAFRRLGSLV